MAGIPQLESWGIQSWYWDSAGTQRHISPQTAAAILESMGADREHPVDPGSVVVVRTGERRPVPLAAEIETEAGAIIPVADALPGDLAPGYHWLRPPGSDRPTRLIVSPGACHLPADLRRWGFAVQLYGLRSRRSWGFGDLADLRRFGHWAAGQGAGMVLLSPLHAPAPGLPQQRSPYFPSSRLYRNPLHLSIGGSPGARRLAPQLQRLRQAGERLNADRAIDRDAVYRVKREALDLLFQAFRGDPRYRRFVAREGVALERFAAYCALAEHHGAAWHAWPAEYRHPEAPAVAAFARAEARAVEFHRWVQWVLDEQLAKAAPHAPLINDLAVGVDPDGADAWAWQDVIPPGMRIGAPPDAFAPGGQDWGLPPFDPWKLRAAAYEPFIQMLRAAFRHGGGLRLDHVMGLFRLYWIPAGGMANEGAYVRYPAGELLDILALESARSQAIVVGEDLGTVEDETRAELERRKVLSYRLLWFEARPPSAYPEQALAAVTTHDLPTIAGAWTGTDLRAQRDAGLEPNDAEQARMVERLRAVTGLPPDAAVEDVIVAAYAALAASPSRLVALTLEDGLAVEERPNLPGTMRAANWSLALPVSLEEIERAPRLQRLCDVMRR